METEDLGYCFLAAVPMRSEPSDRSEMVSQLLLGDTFHLLEIGEKWTRVRNCYDDYEGWIDNKQYILASQCGDAEKQALARMLSDRERRAAEAGSSPSRYAEQNYLGTPYLWGGKNPMGIDCSGLTQVCFQACGKRLLRDASQQVTQGVVVPSIDDVRPDDLCFFGPSVDKITHVGMAIGGGRIIHSSGFVRVDRLDATGIYDEAKEIYTHYLQAIRRIVK